MTNAALKPTDLRVGGVVDPLGIDDPQPLLSWKLAGSGRGRMQTAYQVIVAADVDPASIEPSWDSGIIAAHANGVRYGGAALRARTRYYWRIRSVDEGGQASEWSELASWEMGLLEPADWMASHWIGGDQGQRPTVSLETARPSRPLARIWVSTLSTAERHATAKLRLPVAVPFGVRILGAGVTVGGAGTLTVMINGIHVPAVGDVTFAVRPGDNVLAIAADAGPNDPVGVVARLEVWMEGRRPVSVDTDGRWRAVNDAPAGWELPGFDDSGWPLAERIGCHGEPPRGREPASYRPSPYLRRDFVVDRPVRRARLYATSLGLYELHINGERVSGDYLAPGWTDYSKRVPYQTYEVTAALTPGPNTLGAILGDGWYAGNVGWFGQFQYGSERSLRAQLEIEYEDGSRGVIGTDRDWTAGSGGLRYADLQNGVVDDGRLEPIGWSAPGFSSSQFRPASVYAPAHGELVAQVAPPIRVNEEIAARTVTRRDDGRVLVDFGQNLVGWVRLRLRGAAGQRILVRHAEALKASGELYTEALRSASAIDEYILRGEGGGEVFEPRFTVHGFRYAEIHGTVSIDDIVARVAFADMAQTGDFQCSHTALDRLQQNIVWGLRGNFLSVPTDCPQRDERLGWTGDAQVFASTAAFNYDVRSFFRKWLTDLVDAQRPDGAITHVAPDVVTGSIALRTPTGDPPPQAGAAGWGDAIAIIPWALHQAFADPSAIEQTYDAIGRWLVYLQHNSTDFVRPNDVFGDWLAITPTPSDLVSTAFFAYVARIAAELARVLGRDDDAHAHEALFAKVRHAFRETYVGGGGTIASGTQTAYVLAIHCGLLDDDEWPRASQRLVDEIASRNWHLTTGFLGTPYLLSVLTRTGHLDVAYRLLMQDTFPSWLYPVVHGDATTIWERWDSWSDSRGFQDPAMTSFNHYAYGAVGDWIYRTVGGIEPASPGYREITICPRLGGGLSWARSSYESVHGRIATFWANRDGQLTLDVTIPISTTARIFVPTNDPATVTESSLPAGESTGVDFEQYADGSAIYRVGSGDYSFSAQIDP